MDGVKVYYIFVRRWEWRRGGPCSPTIRHFHNQDRQQHFSVIIIVTIIILREGTFIHRHFKEISEICCIHIYIYTLSYLQYIHKYTIHTIYTYIYIPTIYTDIYKYIRLYTNIYIYMKEGWLQIVNTWQSCETHCCLFHCMWETSIYVIDLDWPPPSSFNVTVGGERIWWST